MNPDDFLAHHRRHHHRRRIGPDHLMVALVLLALFVLAIAVNVRPV